MKREIINLKFAHSEAKDHGIDILTIDERYKTHNTYYPDQSLPQRLEFYVMMYVTEGRGQHIIDFIPYEIEPDTFIIIGKNQVHQFSAQQTFSGHLIVFQETVLQRALLNFDTAIASFLFDPINSSAYRINKATPLLPDITRLVEEYQHGPHDSEWLPIICHALGIVIYKTARLGRHLNTPEQRPQFPPKLIAFSNLLEQHYTSHWTAKEYAAELYISTKSLGTLTKKHLDHTPKEVIDRRLLLEIKRQLAHSNLSIKEIAYELGFEDPSNLNKFFKRRHNLTPTEFRKTVRSSI
ncbi:MAG: AraC family transcriptional regulator [Rhodothermaceae bacterium]|nr:AraC family transcriptional regulator [Rhodothermaceae bacterium]